MLWALRLAAPEQQQARQQAALQALAAALRLAEVRAPVVALQRAAAQEMAAVALQALVCPRKGLGSTCYYHLPAAYQLAVKISAARCLAAQLARAWQE
jgi:D-alanyl-D-alanine dipeptidase